MEELETHGRDMNEEVSWRRNPGGELRMQLGDIWKPDLRNLWDHLGSIWEDLRLRMHLGDIWRPDLRNRNPSVTECHFHH